MKKNQPPATVPANSPGSVEKPVRIAFVKDLAEVRDSWTRLIGDIPNFKCVCTCASGEEALHRLPAEAVDVVLMDIQLPRMSGIACTARLKPLMPNTQILILTVSADSDTSSAPWRRGRTVICSSVPAPGNCRRRCSKCCGGACR